MQYHSARYYLPWLGRWLSADPSGVKGGVNLYEYAAGNPVMKNDKKGLQPDPADTEPELIGSEVIEVHGTAPKTDELSIQAKAGNSSVKTRDQFEDQEKREYFRDPKHLTPAQIAEYYDGHPERETAYYKGLQERYNKYWIYQAGDLEHQQRLVDAGANVGNYIVVGYAGAAVATVGAVAAASSLIALANSSAATAAATAASGGGGATVLINELPDVVPEAGETVPAAAEAVAALTGTAPATVENFEDAVTQVGTRLPEIVSDVYRYRRLDIIVVKTLDGIQGFYRSDGMFSKMANRWLPFDEIAIRWIRIGEADHDFYGDTEDWFNKDAYTEVAGFVENTPFYRFGSQVFKDVSDALGELVIPKGINVETKEEINRLLDFFGARITKHITERGF